MPVSQLREPRHDCRKIVLILTWGTLLTMLNYVFDSLLIALEMADVVTPS